MMTFLAILAGFALLLFGGAMWVCKDPYRGKPYYDTAIDEMYKRKRGM